jgi:serine/threonine-protein kinase
MGIAVGVRVGRYVVRRWLADGGMGTVYLASATGAEGFAKDVALKVLREALGEDPSFVEMFIAEARLACRLNHANLVHIFDFGLHERSHYLAMEYVRGLSLQGARLNARARGVAVPVVLAAEICAQVARGLHSAHTTDFGDGQVGAVHRDVSPHNILLSYDGAIKVADFGIAKLASAHTVPGALKGKFAYMAPEQACGGAVDARTDVFALGIVLWELLTGARLFGGDSDVAVLNAVRERLIAPPERLNSEVPAELSLVTMRALERDPGARFQTARDFEHALTAFVLRHATGPEQVSVAGFLEELLPRGDMSESGVAWSAPLGEGTGEGGAAPSPTEATAVTVRLDQGDRRRASARALAGVGALALLVGLAVALGAWTRRRDADASVPAGRAQASAAALAEGAPPATAARAQAVPPLLGQEPSALVAVAGEGASRSAGGEAVSARAEPSGSRSAGGSADASAVLGSLEVRAVPFALVWIDGRDLGEVLGQRDFALPPGMHRVRLTRNRLRRDFEVALGPGETARVSLE